MFRPVTLVETRATGVKQRAFSVKCTDRPGSDDAKRMPQLVFVPNQAMIICVPHTATGFTLTVWIEQLDEGSTDSGKKKEGQVHD